MKINKRKSVLLIIGAVLVLLLIILFLTHHKKKQEVSFTTAKVTRGAISNVITATGTIQALKTVEVGTQVSGVINKIYVDFNSHVKKGQLLAELDKTPLLASLQDAQASLDNANADLVYNEANYDRIKALYDKKLVAESDYDQALYNYSRSVAGMKVAQAKYDKAEINLEYASILSPIDGVILNRAVNEGQTVAASFNTPTLFSIANDLTQMQVEASVDEADIGQIKDGQKVEFTVDAYPDDNFKGIVTQVRIQPVTVSNVTTYTVIVKAENPDKKLMPGMTANIVIIIQENPDALIIPSKALRFMPDRDKLGAYFKPFSGNANERFSQMPQRRDSSFRQFRGNNRENMKIVWIEEDKKISPRHIETGIDDGINVEVKKGLKEDDEVVIAMESSGKEKISSRETATNPFMPRPPSRRR